MRCSRLPALYTYTNLREDKVRLQKTVDMVFWICGAVAAPVALALFIAAPDFVLLLYGERWLPSVPILQILLIVAIIRPFWKTSAPYLSVWACRSA